MSKRHFAVIAASLFIAACGNEEHPLLLSDSCVVDHPLKETAIERGKPLPVGGWAFDKTSGLSPENVSIQVVSEDQRTVKIIKATRGTKRPDVAKALNAPGAEGSGFDVAVDTSALNPGKYAIYVIQKTDAKTMLCAREFTFSVM